MYVSFYINITFYNTGPPAGGCVDAPTDLLDRYTISLILIVGFTVNVDE
jgi:hypothetical protein